MRLPHLTTLAALEECQSAVDTLRKPGKHRAVEIGKPYLDSNQDQSVSSITDFPGVEKLIRAAHADFGHAEPLWDSINASLGPTTKGEPSHRTSTDRTSSARTCTPASSKTVGGQFARDQFARTGNDQFARDQFARTGNDQFARTGNDQFARDQFARDQFARGQI